MNTPEQDKKIWARRIQESRTKHSEMVKEWARKVLKEYGGNTKRDEDTGETYTQLAQVVVSVEETIQPHLFFQSPTFYAKAKRPDFEKREQLVSAVINHEYHSILESGHQLELENELVILDARLLPYGGTKTRWDVKGEIVEQEREEQGLVDKVAGFLTGSSKESETWEIPVILEEKGHVTERFDPFKVFIDPSAKHITKMGYVVEELDLRKEDLMVPRYDQEKVKKLKPDCLIASSDTKLKGSEIQFDNYDEDQKGYRVYECHDLKTDRVSTYSEQINDFLEYDQEDNSSYAFLWFIEVPNQAYPEAPYKFYRQRAKEYSYIYSQVSEQIDKFIPKIGINIEALDKPAQERFKAGNLGSLIPFKGAVVGQWEEINPKVNPDLFKYLAMIKELLFLEAGVNDYETAVVDDERTATEAQIMAQGTKSRRFKPKKRVRDFLIAQATNIFKLLARNQDERRFVKILGEDEALDWWSDPETGKPGWTKENLDGDYLFELDVESMLPANEALRKRQNTEAMETVLNPALKESLLEEGQQLVITPIFEKYLKENIGISDKNRVVKKMQGLEPGDEHTLWMQGQYPEVSEREKKDEKFMVKHFQAHKMFIESPGFQMLTPEMQSQALAHFDSYTPLIAALLQKKQAQQERPKAQKIEKVSSPSGIEKGVQV